MAKAAKASKAKPKTAHEAILQELIPEERRADYSTEVRALAARNILLSTLEDTRESQELPKKELAKLAGLEASSVRRMLTAQTANPTTETAFRLLAAMDIGLEAVLPSGKRVSVV